MVMPINLLEKSLDKRLSLLLKDNRILEGKLVGYDDYMNLVIEDTEGGITRFEGAWFCGCDLGDFGNVFEKSGCVPEVELARLEEVSRAIIKYEEEKEDRERE